jgi:hypothetical protein
MQMIGPFRKELRCRTDERCGRRSLKYVDGRKATNAAAARGQSLPLPRSGLVQQNLSVIRIVTTKGGRGPQRADTSDTLGANDGPTSRREGGASNNPAGAANA